MQFPFQTNHSLPNLCNQACIARRFPSFDRCHPIKSLIFLVIVVLLVGCQSATPAEEVADPVVQELPTTDVTAAPPKEDREETADDNTVPGGTSATNDSDTDESAALESAPPARLVIPAIDFATAVEPMAWQVTDVEGERQAVWEVPDLNAGWHINSASVGAPGNMIISGHHLQGAAVFAPLARGEVTINDEILVTDTAGQTYLYQVSELADPIPTAGATEEEVARIAAYQAPAENGKLTLLTGWPDFSDTHYLFIVAELIGEFE